MTKTESMMESHIESLVAGERKILQVPFFREERKLSSFFQDIYNLLLYNQVSNNLKSRLNIKDHKRRKQRRKGQIESDRFVFFFFDIFLFFNHVNLFFTEGSPGNGRKLFESCRVWFPSFS